MDLSDWTRALKALGDPTRLRLLALLGKEELTVAELAAVTDLAQPRISTHLARLKDADFVIDRRAGVSSYYRIAAVKPASDGSPSGNEMVWRSLLEAADDPLLALDAERLPNVLAMRAADRNWADSVAGDMERHYSPGRTWEALARGALSMLEPGRVLDVGSGDGVVAELLAPQATSYLCIDASPRVVEAARRRLAHLPHVDVATADMHALPCADAEFDWVLMLHALTFSEQPAQALAEAARALVTGGKLLVITLAQHRHRAIVEPFGHVNAGFRQDALVKMARQAGFSVDRCDMIAREVRPPHFEILALKATRR